jgi:hypothetical protein
MDNKNNTLPMGIDLSSWCTTDNPYAIGAGETGTEEYRDRGPVPRGAGVYLGPLATSPRTDLSLDRSSATLPLVRPHR